MVVLEALGLVRISPRRGTDWRSSHYIELDTYVVLSTYTQSITSSPDSLSKAFGSKFPRSMAKRMSHVLELTYSYG